MIRTILKKPALTCRFTSLGKKTLLLSIIIGAGALNTGVNLLYLVFALLLGAIIASGVLSGITLWDVRASLRLPAGVFAKEQFYGTVRLRNLKKRFASYSVWVSDGIHDLLGEGAYFFSVPAKKQRSTGFQHTFAKRGLVKVESLGVLTRFPFGLFEKEIKVATEQSVLVFPKIYPLQSAFRPFGGSEGFHEKPRKGMGSELLNLRRYQDGDHPRHIHWKSSAHLGRLMVREFSCEEEAGGVMIFDNRANGGGLPEAGAFDACVSVVASVAAFLLRNGMRLHFAAWNNLEKDCAGEEGLHRILRVLALIEPVSPSETAELIPPRDLVKQESGLAEKGIILGLVKGEGTGRFDYLDLPAMAAEMGLPER